MPNVIVIDMPRSALEEVTNLLKKINALTMAPHWTADRRWKIEQYSQQALNLTTHVLRQFPSPEDIS